MRHLHLRPTRSHFGHDKSLAIRPYAAHIAKLPDSERPTLFYAGDGVSDLSAARETDLLFAKKGHGTLIRNSFSGKRKKGYSAVFYLY